MKITLRQEPYLRFLNQRDTASLTHIHTAIGNEHQSSTRVMVTKLIKAGYVKRDGNDWYKITPYGKSVIAEFDAWIKS